MYSLLHCTKINFDEVLKSLFATYYRNLEICVHCYTNFMYLNGIVFIITLKLLFLVKNAIKIQFWFYSTKHFN